MISTQRLIIMFVLINLAVTIATFTYQEETTWNSTPFDNMLNQVQEFEEKAQEDESVIGGMLSAAAKVIEATVIDPIRFGWMILKFLYYAFVPFSINGDMASSTVEEVFIVILSVVRSVLAVLAGLEIYLIFKNKKAT